MNCPNKNTIEWKTLVEKLGEDGAYRMYIAMGEDLPPLSTINSILSSMIIPNIEVKGMKDEQEIQDSKYIEMTKQIAVHELQGYQSIQQKIEFLQEFDPNYGEIDIQGETINHQCK